VPGAHEVEDLIDAPMVVVTGDDVLVDGVLAGSARALRDAGTSVRVPELAAILRGKRELWMQRHPERANPGLCLLHVDEDLPASVVKSVFSTVASAGCHSPAFVVRRLATPTSLRTAR
jgi:hypothetical protein